MASLQDWIHRLEVGGGTRYLKRGLLVLALLGLFGGYNWRAYRNMSAREAMDAAQVARNIAEGKGYTTLFVRPFSIYLVKKANAGKSAANAEQSGDAARIKEMHPDLANPPVYPLVLACWMKVYPALLKGAEVVREHSPQYFQKRLPHFNDSLDNYLWHRDGRFAWHPHDFFISLFNQFLFLTVVVMTFLLARSLFDPTMALLSAILLLGTELLWRFSTSGLSTMLLLAIFMALLWCLMLLERSAREGKWGQAGLVGLTALAGVLVGIGALTRYAFGWLIVPVVVFLLLFSGQRRIILGLLALGAFLLVMSPWVARNFNVSRTPFGTATFALVEGGGAFPENRLERSLDPDFNQIEFGPLWRKLLTNTRQILQNDLPKLGDSWVTAFFLVGLLVGFRNPAISRLRYFLLLCLAILIVVQALGRTQLSEESPEINSENLLVLLVPLVLIYGGSLFFLLLDQVQLPVRQVRYAIIGGFGVVACAPMIFTFLPPRVSPLAYPPYYPPVIQQTAGWMKEKELMMSDIPWAVAWYGRRQCLWLTLKAIPDAKDLNSHEDFFAINDYQKPIQAIYLTPLTMDTRFLSQWIRAGGESSWNTFVLESLLRKEFPRNFPLRVSAPGFMPDQLFLTDRERWKKTEP